MNALPDLARLVLLHARLRRLHDSGHEIALATGLDELLPVLASLLAVQPQLHDIAEDVRDTDTLLHQVQNVLVMARDDEVPARALHDLLAIPHRILHAQAARLQKLVHDTPPPSIA